MSKVQKPRVYDFDPSIYTRGSLRESEVLEIKEQFDTFDLDRTGLINPRCKCALTKN